MKLWMSRGFQCGSYTFWKKQPEVEWNSRDEPQIGYKLMHSGFEICEMHNVGKLFPELEIPPGEMVEIEIVVLERGYYIGIVEE